MKRIFSLFLAMIALGTFVFISPPASQAETYNLTPQVLGSDSQDLAGTLVYDPAGAWLNILIRYSPVLILVRSLTRSPQVIISF